MDQREAQRRAGSGLPVYMSRALVSLGGMLFLGLGLGMYVHKGASLLWILGLLATLGPRRAEQRPPDHTEQDEQRAGGQALQQSHDALFHPLARP